MEGIIYLTLEQAEAIHEKTIKYSGGGTSSQDNDSDYGWHL